MAKQNKLKNYTIVLNIPAWATWVYAILAIILIPWTVYLAFTLPKRHLSAHWDVSWTGLDIGLTISLLATGLCAYMKSIWVVITASTAGSFLLLDAWFDILSERNSSLFHQALLSAILFEIPLAIMSYSLASHALNHTNRHNNSGENYHKSL